MSSYKFRYAESTSRNPSSGLSCLHTWHLLPSLHITCLSFCSTTHLHAPSNLFLSTHSQTHTCQLFLEQKTQSEQVANWSQLQPHILLRDPHHHVFTWQLGLLCQSIYHPNSSFWGCTKEQTLMLPPIISS